MRRVLLSLCAFLIATTSFANDAPQSAEVTVLEVFADHYEIDGAAYHSVTDLVAALRALKGKNALALRQHDYDDATLQHAAAARMREANHVARRAGFRRMRRIGFVTNEIF